jgi:molybdopterin converting factor subunit 1
MTVYVRLFAGMAEGARVAMLTLDLAEGSRAGSVKAELQRRHPELPWPKGTLWAINQEYAGEDSVLHEGDEVAVIPPVSGG